jgi:hypothetical protein
MTTMLSPPLVVEPVTPCVKRVSVQNLLTGAEVEVFADGLFVGRGTADGPAIAVALFRKISTGMKLVATQSLGGETSDVSPEAVEVLAEPAGPADLGRIQARSPLLECGECVWIEGVIPGATVTLTVGGAALPPVEVDGTGVHFDVPGGLGAGEPVSVQQDACGISGPTISLAAPRAQAPNTWPAPAPRVDEPVYECQQTLYLQAMRSGATIVLARGGEEDRVCFGAADGLFTYDAGLSAGEEVVLWQEFSARECRLVSNRGSVRAVPGPPSAPFFPFPICAGDQVVTVSGLVSRAVVELLADGVPLCQAGVVASTARIALPATGLGRTNRLGVHQRLCDGGPWSTTRSRRVATLGPASRPRIEEPLFDCGTAVGVWSLTAGTVVWVLSDHWRGLIGFAIAEGDERTDVNLWFPLMAGDWIGVRTLRCGLGVDSPRLAQVQARPDLAPPRMADPADDCGGAVIVKGVVPGSIVEVEVLASDATPPEVMGSIVGSVRATTSTAFVPVPVLAPRTWLRARQRLCDRQPSPSNPVRLGLAAKPLYQATQRICQLTGASDPVGLQHPFDTTSIDLLGTDLGIPVEHGGTLWMFFGDCLGDEDRDILPHGDPIAWTQDEDLGPIGIQPPNLRWVLNEDGVFQRLVVDGLPRLDAYEVPTGGFSYGSSLYLFVGRENVPLDGADGMRTSHLAVAEGGIAGQTPQLLYDMGSTIHPGYPTGRWLIHVSPTVVRNADWPGLPSDMGDGVLLFGTAQYQKSDMFLAWFPIAPGVPPPHPSTWRFFTGTTGGGLVWRTVSEMAQPGATFTAPAPLLDLGPNDIKLAEISVRFVPRMRRWVLTYVWGLCRVARDPLGPWSPPETIFDRADPSRDAGNSQPGGQFLGEHHDGRKPGTYAPYVIDRWTRFDRSRRWLELVYTLSTEGSAEGLGYEPQLMRTFLVC